MQEYEAHCTLISLTPYDIRETRPSVVPFEYLIPKSDGRNPSVLVIGHGRSALDLLLRPETFVVPIPVEQLAADLVKNHIESQPEYGEDAQPAFFFIPGSLTPKEILEKHKLTVDFYLNRQTNWFQKLVKAADDNWARNKQRRMISDKYILAAQKLAVRREWMDLDLVNAANLPTIEMISCPYCSFQVPSKAPLCMNCKAVINPEEKKRLDLQMQLASVAKAS